MFIRSFIIALSVFATFNSFAEPFEIARTMYCDETKNIVKELRKYKELPVIVGDAEDEAKSKMTVWINLETGSWTILSTKKNLSCVVGVGDNFQVLDLPKLNTQDTLPKSSGRAKIRQLL